MLLWIVENGRFSPFAATELRFLPVGFLGSAYCIGALPRRDGDMGELAVLIQIEKFPY